jgi:aldose sugar dehydrogenase
MMAKHNVLLNQTANFLIGNCYAMKKRITAGLIFLFATTCVCAQQGEIIYQNYCAGCHGSKLEGNSASKLIKKNWAYGEGRQAIQRNITSGIPNTEMMGWGTVLKDGEITAVVDFILAAQAKEPASKAIVPDRIPTQEYVLKVEKLVTEGIRTPWAIEFVDKNKALVTEKGGSIRWLVNGRLDPEPIRGLPATHTQSSTGGYMDIALDPKYSKNGWVYLSYSHTNGNVSDKEAPGMTKIVRGRIKGHQWTEQQTLFEVPEELMVKGGDRWGCRFLFDKNGFLYFTIGDMGKAMDSQDLSRPTGKVYRIHPDGSIPNSNPFVKVPKALPAIFTIGNRNVQGLAQHPVTGQIWATEHGPRGGDELNILKKGANYGWPVITYGVDYDGKIVSEKDHQEGMEQPVIEWTPSIAVCPAEFSGSPLFPKWKNNLLVGALAYEELQRLTLVKDKVTAREMIFKGFGRVRDIKTSPDGAIYVLLNKPDMILRITPEQ